MSAVTREAVGAAGEPGPPGDPLGGLAGHRRRRRRVRMAAVVGVVVVVVGAAAAAGLGLGGRSDQQRPVSTGMPPARATVTKDTLTQTEQLGGTLGYGATTTVTARASAAASAPDGTGGSGGGDKGGAGTGGNDVAGASGAPGTTASDGAEINGVAGEALVAVPSGSIPAAGGPTTTTGAATTTGTTTTTTRPQRSSIGKGGKPSAPGGRSSGTGSSSTNPAASGSDRGPGTITWLPAVGTVVEPGRAVYKVDNRPVVLLSGTLPLWRVLATGITGPDVRLLETNLRRFGLRGFTVDETFTTATATAVKRWQGGLGVAKTGKVDVNQVVVARGRIRVTEHLAALGAEAVGEVLTYTGTRRVVTIPLGVTRQHLLRVGLSAEVTLPTGKTVTGRVDRIGTVATASGGQGDGQGGEGSGTPTVEVVVTIADQAPLGRLDAAPVELSLVTDSREDVLTVPVGALVALAEGGYGVQVVEGATTRYVPVEAGMFADGRVEVSGSGIAEGMTVGVPA